MENYKFILCLMLIGVFVKVNSLQCYVCVDCPDGTLKDEWLEDCGANETTVAPPLATTLAPENSTEVPIPPGNSTEVPIPPGNSTEVPIPPGNSTEVPIPPGNSTEVPEPPGNYTDYLTDELDNPNTVRVRRNVLPEILTLDSGCQCNDKGCTCNDAQKMQNYADAAATIEYVCAKGTIKNETGTEIVARGCAPKTVLDMDICTFLINEANATSCMSCNTDKCNNAIALQQPFAALILVLTLAFFTK